MSDRADKFQEIFRDACQRIPTTPLLVDWMVFCLGVLSVHASEEELWLCEKEIYKKRELVVH